MSGGDDAGRDITFRPEKSYHLPPKIDLYQERGTIIALFPLLSTLYLQNRLTFAPENGGQRFFTQTSEAAA